MTTKELDIEKYGSVIKPNDVVIVKSKKWESIKLQRKKKEESDYSVPVDKLITMGDLKSFPFYYIAHYLREISWELQKLNKNIEEVIKEWK